LGSNPPGTPPRPRPSRRERFFILILGLAGIMAGLAMGIWFWPPTGEGLTQAAASAGFTAITPAPASIVGSPAPDFLLQDLHGRAVQLSEMRGEPVVVAFWATWCEPCRTELPVLNSEAARWKVLAVNYGEAPDIAAAYAEELNLDKLTILLDPDFAARNLYRVSGLPSTFVVDANGKIQFLKIGSYDLSEITAALTAPGGTR
jgi:thiol-disulfide isomerase/thioredoxin